MAALDNKQILDIIDRPNKKSKYPNQKMYVVEINNDVYWVPFVQMSDKTVFLKTIIPSRKAKKRYSKAEVDHES